MCKCSAIRALEMMSSLACEVLVQPLPLRRCMIFMVPVFCSVKNGIALHNVSSHCELYRVAILSLLLRKEKLEAVYGLGSVFTSELPGEGRQEVSRIYNMQIIHFQRNSKKKNDCTKTKFCKFILNDSDSNWGTWLQCWH